MLKLTHLFHYAGNLVSQVLEQKNVLISQTGAARSAGTSGVYAPNAWGSAGGAGAGQWTGYGGAANVNAMGHYQSYNAAAGSTDEARAA